GSGRLVTRLDTPPSSHRHHPDSAIALQYGFEKRSNTKRTLGSHFVFAFVVPLAEKATDENCVIVEDCQPEEFERAASMCNPDSMSHLDDKSRANAAKYGFRLYDYERRFVH
ncbi:hypothetical protein, partial [Bradyrhizobium liaoningense]